MVHFWEGVSSTTSSSDSVWEYSDWGIYFFSSLPAEDRVMYNGVDDPLQTTSVDQKEVPSKLYSLSFRRSEEGEGGLDPSCCFSFTAFSLLHTFLSKLFKPDPERLAKAWLVSICGA